ncbi:hypothetical protein U1Q18_001682 [Sarracenia purpurea var. burkii]
MAVPCSLNLLLYLILFITTHFSGASSHAQTQLRRHQLEADARQSTSAAANDGGVTVELWCVAKNNAEDSALQSALDWACGAGGADCGKIQQGGPCYDSGDIQRTASYAFNDYFLKHGLTDDSCNFDGTAALTSLNPSHGGCTIPSSFTVNNGSFNGSPITVGIGPASADISSGTYFTGSWYYWFLITTHLFYLTPLNL